MSNIISGYRKMAGLTQKKMARELGISEGTYRNKEKGRTFFKNNEMKTFFELVKRENSTVTINEIFFDHTPTKNDVLERGDLNAKS